MMNEGAFDADIDYALRMIRAGCATVEQAARTCGIPLAILQARLTSSAQSNAAPQSDNRFKTATKARA